jgi:uncharacterized protein
MLYFNIRALEQRSESVDGRLHADDPVWEEADARPVAEGVHVVGRLSAAGHGRFFFSGSFAGAALTECRRCLTLVERRVEEPLQLLFAEVGLDEADEDDVVALPVDALEIDLRPAVREEWVLSVPAYAVCREECRGLCPSCGIDRNDERCDCGSDVDFRWAALRDLKQSPS